ncbi:lamin tail domain-containing protein [Candidatus Parcubacteria bacterium]|nr:lamin tail domain-containing protein [Candidatus Parcubacteria bacterium]
MDKSNKIIYFLITSIFFCGSFSLFNNFIFANNNVEHLVISEIQIGGETVYDEFIELYNPTDQEINLENWDLKRKTKSGNESNILNNIEGAIPAHGYFLIVPRANCGESKTEDCYKGLIAADDEYTTNSFIAKDNTILLYDSNENLIDKVGWGGASDFESEVIINNPENSQSLERININGAIQDTDNNKNDFVLRDNPEPRNSNNSVDDSEQEDSTQACPPWVEVGANDDNNNQETDSDFDQDTESDNDGEQDGSTQETGANSSIPKIIITEFLPNPEDSDRDNEFIEIYNDGDAEVNLDGWTLEDKIGRIKKFVIPDRTEINAGKYKAFYSDETRITLNNSGDGVVLRDNKDNIIDESPVSDSVKEEQSYALDKNGSWVLTLRPTPGRENIIKAEEKIISEKTNEKKDSESLKDSESKEQNYETSDAQDGSTQARLPDGQEYGANNGYDYSDKIVVSEIYPNPFGRDNREGNYEWIELYNNSDKDVNLKGWQIDDILGKGSKAHIIKENKIIKARSFAVFENIQTKIMLNNSGDEINILWPDGEVVDNLRYEKADEGLSYNWTSDSWVWSNEITPGKNNKTEMIVIEKKLSKNDFKNNLEQGFVMGVEDAEDELGEIEDMEIDYIEADIKNIKHFTRHSRVKISGIVSTPPGIFSDNIFYLSGSGIQVFSYEARIPRIELGDKIEIIGRVSEVGGEKRILLDNAEDIKIISHDNLVEAQLTSTGNINESVEGYLIMTEGKVSQIKNDVFSLDDGSGEIKIYIKPQTEIEKPKIKIGDWMVIIGQASQTSAGYRILPRFQGDIKLSRVSGTSTAKAASDIKEAKNKVENNKNSLWSILFFIIIAFVLVDWGRMKIAKSRKSIKSIK